MLSQPSLPVVDRKFQSRSSSIAAGLIKITERWEEKYLSSASLGARAAGHNTQEAVKQAGAELCQVQVKLGLAKHALPS